MDGRTAGLSDRALPIPVDPRRWEPDAPAADEQRGADGDAPEWTDGWRGEIAMARPLWDSVGVVAGLALAQALIGGIGIWAVIFGVLLVLGPAARGQYQRRISASALDDLPGLLVTCGAAGAVVVLSRHLLGLEPAGAALVNAGLITVGCLLVSRIALAATQRRRLKSGRARRRTMICGSDQVAEQLHERLTKQPALGLQPVALSDPNHIGDGLQHATELLAPSQPDARAWLETHRIEHLIVAVSPELTYRYAPFLDACQAAGIPISYLSHGIEHRAAGAELDATAGLPLLRIRSHRARVPVAIKHAGDRVLAGLLLLATAPVQLAIAAAIRLTMGSPILFRQRRVGTNGETFDMLKFRTMAPVGAEVPPPAARWSPGEGLGPGGVEGFDRRTRMGRFLRRSSLDELPQLITVLRGEMSLVGPRPERPEYVQRYVSEIHRYGERHRVRVGITGLAQVQGLRGRTSLAERIAIDNAYIDNWSLWLDAQILLRTVRAVLRDPPE